MIPNTFPLQISSLSAAEIRSFFVRRSVNNLHNKYGGISQFLSVLCDNTIKSRVTLTRNGFVYLWGPSFSGRWWNVSALIFYAFVLTCRRSSQVGWMELGVAFIFPMRLMSEWIYAKTDLFSGHLVSCQAVTPGREPAKLICILAAFERSSIFNACQKINMGFEANGHSRSSSYGFVGALSVTYLNFSTAILLCLH